MVNKSGIIENWNKWSLTNQLPIKVKRSLKESDIHILKDGITRSVWRIDVPLSNGTFPVVLKLYKGSKTFRKYYEWNVYRKLEDTPVGKFMPDFYEIQIDRENPQVWIFTEYLNVYGEKSIFKPVDLYKITSALAKLHAITFDHQPIADLIRRTIPGYQTEQRHERFENIKIYLQQARKDKSLKKVIDQNCPEVYEIAELDLDFPEVIRSGQCLTHGDLHIDNICYDENDDKIRFIDYGVASYAPCWLDLVKLVETVLENRFEGAEDAIRNKCIKIYVKEMKQAGISFPGDPGRMYRMAYLMRVFEKELRRNLRATLRGKRPFDSHEVLKKVSIFSKDLNLI